MTKLEILNQARQMLNDPMGVMWDEWEIDRIIEVVLDEVTERQPNLKIANLAITPYSTNVLISGLTDLNKIIRIFYPILGGSYDPVWRSGTRLGNIVKLDLSSDPTITSGTLTGTVTFTKDSQDVTGSGTLFLTELSAGVDGDLICLSSGSKYYQVSYITDNTHLTLRDPFAETTATDTINMTKYRDYESCAGIVYGGDYTLSSTVCDLTEKKLKNAVVIGIVAHAAKEYAATYLQTKLESVTSKISSAATAIGNITARITQALTDLGTNRTNLGADLTAYTNSLTEAESELDAVTANVASGIAVVDTVNIGGDIASKYAQLSQAGVMNAQQRLAKGRTYLESAKTSHDYIDMAIQELASGITYANQAQGYILQTEQSINVRSLVAAYNNWADLKFQEYQNALNKLGRFSDDESLPTTRGL